MDYICSWVFCLDRRHVGFDVGCMHAVEKLNLFFVFNCWKVVCVNYIHLKPPQYKHFQISRQTKDIARRFSDNLELPLLSLRHYG